MSKTKDETMMFGFCEAIMDEDQDDLAGDSDGEVDQLSIRSANSDTEQEVSDEEGDASFQDTEKDDHFCTGKDGTTIWYSNPLKANVTSRSENTEIAPGVKPYARMAKTELDCWKLFISDEMLEEILQHTNVEIKSRTLTENHLTRVHLYKETNMDELLAVFGLMYIAGLNNTKGNNLTDLWRSDGTGVDIFRMSMSLQRFNFLQSCLRFDDSTTREERNKLDNIAPVRSMFDKFINNCQKAYKPGKCLTMDEKFIPFRGKCPFRQFMPNTAAAYGIKMYALVDVKVFYTVNMEIHAGKQPDGPFALSNQPFDVVDRLVAPISQTNRNVTFDNWFTSIPLVTHLLSKHGLTATGALRKNKQEVPQQFTNTRGRGVNSAQFGFNDDLTLVSYVPKKSKVVLLLSSYHHDRSIDAKTDKPKPEIVSFYNATKIGVDVIDKLCSTYDVRNYCKSWPTLILFTMMNIAAINGVTVFRENNKSKVRRCEFIRVLGLALLNQHLISRKNKENLPRELRKRIYEQMGETLNYPPTTNAKPYKRCRDCPSSKDRKTKYTCIECQKPICLQHVVASCQNCSNLSID